MSSRVTPSHSRSSSRHNQVARAISGHHIDDQSLYHNRGSFESSSAGSNSSIPDPEKGEGVAENRDGIQDSNDRSSQFEKTESLQPTDPNLVELVGEEDPKNWTPKRKWAATFIVSIFTLLSPLASSMIAPAVPTISRQFHITSQLESQLTFSIFVLAYAIGPFFLAPLSESYGRPKVLQFGNLIFLTFNSACGGARNKGELIAFRFLAGLGGSVPLGVGGGVLSDLFRSHERGKAVGIYSLAPLLGPALGPIMGGFITDNISWRWIFFVVSFADVAVQVLGLIFLKETYLPVLVHRKKLLLIEETGNHELYTKYDSSQEEPLLQKLGHGFVRPFRLIGTQPIVQVIAVYMAFLYGIMYLVLSTFPTLWTEVYHESIGIAGLNYISLGLGFFLGAQLGSRLNDYIYGKLTRRNNGVGKPEFRAPMMIPGTLLVPTGLFIYGWSAQARTHWIVPNIGACIFSSGVIMGFQMMQTYIVDTYTRYAASALSAVTFLRSLAGFGFPLFAPYLYQSLDLGWGNSLLGFIAIALGIPAPFLLWKFGEPLRKRSTFAAGDFI